MNATTQLQAFGLIVTAEPYFSVIRPSDKVVAENIIRQETKGFEQPIHAKFEMLESGQYTVDLPAAQLPASAADSKTPLDLLEARTVAIAKTAGAAQYAPDTLQKAENLLAQAEDYLRRKQGRTPVGTVARGATQTAEDATGADSAKEGAGEDRGGKAGYAGGAREGGSGSDSVG